MAPPKNLSPKTSADQTTTTKPNTTEYNAIAEQWKKAKRAKEAGEAEAVKRGLPTGDGRSKTLEQNRDKLNTARQKAFERRWAWSVAFWGFMFLVHAVGVWLFTSGFLLTRLVLEEKSTCDAPPIESRLAPLNIEEGCWHPKRFDRAIIVVIDALRYDFTVPVPEEKAQAFHNSLNFLYDNANRAPRHAFLRPFIADPPTTTLQRLKGLTTGTLPTFIDAGSNFAGTAIEEDNLLMQLKKAGKKIAHLGDDTWWSLFPGYFEPNISKAYDSFNVWDLHTVDNGVIDNIFPLMEKERKGEWDVLIGHCLGVDHAGHRYGPNHPAMTAKLQQMNEFVMNLTRKIDDDTLLVVMGDHGMDSKGDHGGESDDEVAAALWMYSKKQAFGRATRGHVPPPQNAKENPTNQIDLVPTLALLLGIPIPYNNLGFPIEEAFVGRLGNDWANLADTARMAAAGIERYQRSYFAARSMVQTSGPGSPAELWSRANDPAVPPYQAWEGFQLFQSETLGICKYLWARFDIARMIFGILITAVGLVVLLMYSSRDGDDDFVVQNDVELDYAEKKLELMGLKGDDFDAHPDQVYHKNLLKGLWDKRLLFIQSILIAVAAYRQQPVEGLASLVVILTLAGVTSSFYEAGKTLRNLLPTSFWGWLSVIFTLGQSVGFASNSYTIWEDSILLFFITTFGICAVIASFRIESKTERVMSVYHSVVFVVLGRVASYSKLCREEQMPYCMSTYYASRTSSTSAPWQLAIPFLVFLILPFLIKSYLVPTRSYEGLAPSWIAYAFRGGLFLSAVYWVVDAADSGEWLADRLPEDTLKTVGVYLAQMVLALALVAGSTAFVWAPPSVSIVAAGANDGQPRIAIMGYSNAMGARYIFLPLNILGACLLLSKPMGSGALAIMMWQILSLAEIVDLNGLKTETIGPIMLAVMGNFYFFKTGHQAVLSSIQWDSAFIPLFGIRYPWTPLVVILNTLGGQIIAAISVPLVILWKVGPKQKGTLETVTRALGVFIAYYAVEAVATMTWAGWLRRHLMLYRVFNPRFMLAAAVLLVLDLLGVSVALLGMRSNTLAVSEVFGWAD